MQYFLMEDELMRKRTAFCWNKRPTWNSSRRSWLIHILHGMNDIPLYFKTGFGASDFHEMPTIRDSKQNGI